MKSVSIYCSSICNEMNSPGAWAALLKYKNIKKEIFGSFPSTNINRLNLIAIISSLGLLKEQCEVALYFDSDYIFNCINNGDIVQWKKNNWKNNDGKIIDNEDIWRMLLIQLKIKKHKVKFRKADLNDSDFILCINNAKQELAKYYENDIYNFK